MSRVCKVFGLGLGVIAMALMTVASVCAQSETTGEPSSRSNSRFQSQAEIAALPPSTAGNTVRAGFTPSTTGYGNQVAGNTASYYRTASAQANVYPYPANRPPRVAIQSNYTLPRSLVNAQQSGQLSVGTNSTISSLRNTTLQSSLPLPAFSPTQARTQITTAYRQPVYQAPTLGLGNAAVRTAQNCNCQPVYNPAGTNRTTVGYQASSYNSAVGSGLAVPPLDIQMPGQPAFSQPQLPQLPQNGQSNLQFNFPTQLEVAPQYGAQGAKWWTPFVTGSGTYPPVIRRQNMPVGTYLGQGLIGQPTAYVDGQPVRNLLRYISP